MDPLTGRPIVLDGGLATTLQREGLPVATPVEPWLESNPERIAACHHAFVEAGAELVLAATFRSLPSEDPRWRAHVPVALGLARASGAREVWLSLGPGEGHARVVELARAHRPDGVVLETFTDGPAATRAVTAIRAVWAGPLVVSYVPHPALTGTSLRRAAEQAVHAGATGVGANCVAGAVVVEAIDTLEAVGVPLWAKPGTEGQDAAWDALLDRVAWLGGCCGTGPEDVRRLAARVSSRWAG